MKKFKIASFNINSINARLTQFQAWLSNSNPDIVLLQETKCTNDKFPVEALLDLGYNAIFHGQKSYNGVAILSKFKLEKVTDNLPNEGEVDEQARYVEALAYIGQFVIRVASIYVPNGGGSDLDLSLSEKFSYKINFFKRLKIHLAKLKSYNEIQVFGGDFNVAAEDIDCFDAYLAKGKILFHPQERAHFRSIINLGFTDSYRIYQSSNNNMIPEFSWFDYRGNSWQKGVGFRIDYLLTSPLATDKISYAGIEASGVRDQEKASDHCPVILELSL